MAAVEESLGNLHIANAPAPPPMPSTLSAGNAPPPPPPPGPGVGMSYKEQRDKAFEEQQMANLPSGLMTTAAKADKKPFSYTPVGLSAADLRAPSSIRKDKLEAIASGEDVPVPGVVPGIPRGPTNVRIFNGITPPAASSFDNSGVVRGSPLQARKASLSRQDSGGSDSGKFAGVGRVAPIQSRSFKILQWMTGADEDDDSILAGTAPAAVAKPSPDADEMRFSGYHRADSIPSRAYQTLEKNVAHHAAPGAGPSADHTTIQPFRDENFRTEFNEETGSNARYTGNAIPSRSFRALQTMTGQPGEQPAGLHVAPPSPTMGRRSPNPAIVQPHYTRNIQSPVNSAPPNRQDFKYQGPQYSTYDLPPPQHHNYAASPGIMAHSGQPRYSSSVTLTPGGGDHRQPQDYADQSSTYRPAGNGYPHPQNAYHAVPASPSYPSPNYQNYSQPAQYQMPSRNVPMASGGHFSGAGRSDF